MNKHRIGALLVFVLLAGLLLAIPPKPASAQFVLAWPNPEDEHGQGLSSLYVYENSTGSFVNVLNSPFYGSEPPFIEVNHTSNTALRLTPVYNVNITYLGYTIIQALDYMRVNLTISVEGTIIYQQNDLANTSYAETIPQDGTWYCGYSVDLPFLIQPVIYTVVFTYEIFM